MLQSSINEQSKIHDLVDEEDINFDEVLITAGDIIMNPFIYTLDNNDEHEEQIQSIPDSPGSKFQATSLEAS